MNRNCLEKTISADFSAESPVPNGSFTSHTFLECDASVTRSAEQPRTPTAICSSIISDFDLELKLTLGLVS